jgi:hypothetical protein
MNTATTLSIFAIVGAMAIVSVASIIIQALANQPVSVLEKKDQKVHEH